MSAIDDLAAAVAASSISTVRVLAWRDLDDPEAGGSELHMDEVMRRWAAAGLRIDVRTSGVAGQPVRIQRHGYFVERAGGRYRVFPEAMWTGFTRDRHHYDALVEIWNGVPFFGPLWFRGPRLTLLHHVHHEMWKMAMPGWLGEFGWWVEHRAAPPIYRRGTIATLSDSSALEIEQLLHLKHPAVVPVGVSDFFSPGGTRSATPLVVAVGRLVPVKRFDRLIAEFIKVRERVPNATFVIASEGYLRNELEDQIAAAGAEEWISLPGRVSDEELRDLYRSAWVLASHSLREGWGMSITEAGACGTPCVVSDIAGHRDAVEPGRSGILVAEGDSLGAAIVELLEDRERLAQMQSAALQFAQNYSWDSVALKLFTLLDDRARSRRRQ